MAKLIFRSSIVPSAIFIFTMFVANPAIAQGDHPPKEKMSRDKIDAQKSAYITSELGLTTQESRDFWPVYDEYQAKKRKILKANKDKCLSLQEKIDSLSPAQQEQLADCPLTFEQQLLDLKKDYHTKYKKIIPPLKLAKLYRAERDFKMLLMKQMRDSKGKQPGQGPPPNKSGHGQGFHEGPEGPDDLLEME